MLHERNFLLSVLFTLNINFIFYFTFHKLILICVYVYMRVTERESGVVMVEWLGGVDSSVVVVQCGCGGQASLDPPLSENQYMDH